MTDLFILDGLARLVLVPLHNATQFVLVEFKLPLGACFDYAQVLYRSIPVTLPWLGRRVEPRLRQLKVPDGPLPIVLVLEGLYALEFQRRGLQGPVGALQLLLLGEEVGEGALAAEDVAAVAGDGAAGRLEAQPAAAKGQEGVAAEARGAGAPMGFGEGALVCGEDGAGGVPLACRGGSLVSSGGCGTEGLGWNELTVCHVEGA